MAYTPEQWKIYYAKNKEKISVQRRQYRKQNDEKSAAWYRANRVHVLARRRRRKIAIKAWQAAYYRRNQKRLQQYGRKWRAKNKKRDRSKQQTYRQKNRAKLAAQNKIWRTKNRDRIRRQQKLWRTLNRKRLRQRHDQRLRTDLGYRVRHYLRTRLGAAIRQRNKAGSAVRDLGCGISEFVSYIATLFKPGMSWDNWGKWHLDHKRPLASFELQNRQQLLIACHYTNFQPLWAADNLRKSGTTDDPWEV